MDIVLQRHHCKTLHFEHEWHGKVTRKRTTDVLYKMQEKSTFIHLSYIDRNDIMRWVRKQNHLYL